MKRVNGMAIYLALFVAMLAIGSGDYVRAQANRNISAEARKKVSPMLSLTRKHENTSSVFRKEPEVGFGAHARHLPGQPPKTSQSSVDLTIVGIEVTQSIQCYQSDDPTCVMNRAPLINRIPTLLRVYVKLSDRDDRFSGGLPGVPVRVRIFNKGVWRSYFATVTARSFAQRSNLNDTANVTFRIMNNSDETIFVQAEVNYNRTIPETNYRNNVYPINELRGLQVGFYNTSPLRVMLVGVGANNVPGVGIVPPPPLDLTTLNFIKQTYPVAVVSPLTSPASITMNGPLAITGDWWMLMARLSALRDNDTTLWGKTAHWYGLVNPLINQSGAGGFGYTPDPTDETTTYWESAGFVSNGPIAAQEIAHNLSRNHAPGCGAPGVDANYPISDGSIGDFGWDSSTNSLIPKAYSDLMGYCPRPWISAYTAAGIFMRRRQVLKDGPLYISAGPASNQEYLLVNGLIQAGDEVTIQPFQRVVRPKGFSDDPGVGPYSLELQTSEGKLLFERRFTPVQFGCSGTCDGQQTAFAERVPYPQAARRVVIKKGERILKTIIASPHAPTVSLDSPNGNETWGHSHSQTISWQAHDLDGDHLTYHLLFSRDDGLTWTGVAAYVDATSITLDPGMFPGTERARFRIIAMDGFNTTSDDSKHPFRIERKPPIVTILSPASDASIGSGVALVLRGLSYDLEDGNIIDANLVWRLDQHTILGSGSELIWDDPSPGLHTISLTARDSDQNSVTAAVHVNVKPK